MKRDLLALLASPCCRAEMKFDSLGDFPSHEGMDVQSGTLSCRKCGFKYALDGGVPRLARPVTDRKALKTRDSFAWEWLRYPGSLPEDEKVLLEETQLSREQFAGKVVLDAGCGMGRYAVVARALGAEVVGLDLSESLARLAAVSARWPKLHAVQGDLLNPPLRDKAFDIVYSQGVLHHTADTRRAFLALARLVRPGGYLSVWLYGKAGRYGEFRTNPLRSGRRWLRFLRLPAWMIVGLRQLHSGLLRAVTTRLPIRATYALCYPIAGLGALPLVKYLTFSVHPRFRVRLIENFDWLSPPYQHHHTKEELAAWFEEAGFDVVRVLPHGLVPKPGILGRRRA